LFWSIGWGENAVPQMNKGGKFIFGKSLIREDLQLQFPPQAVREYAACSEGRVYLFTGARATGGFCVTRRGLLLPSRLGNILWESPDLREFTRPEGEFSAYKGRKYCWVSISETGSIRLTEKMLAVLELTPGMELLSIRSSNIAFTMGAKGPLLERAKKYPGVIEVY